MKLINSNFREILISIIFLVFLFTAIISCKGNREVINSPEKYDKENCSNWISENYVKCIQHQLPCECEKEADSYFVIKLNISDSTILLFKHNDLEVEQYNIEKKQGNCYQIKTVDGLNGKIVGKFIIKGNKLLFFDSKNTKITFQYYGKSEFLNNISYSEENISLLNETFIRKGYDSLEKILKSTSLKCHCTHENKRLNIIWSDNNSHQWLIEIKNDSLYINTIINIDASPEDSLVTKKFKAFKW